MSKDRVLGKGLSALIQGADLRGAPVPGEPAEAVRKVALEAIGFNPDQPRKIFDDNSLEELAASIRQVGILQPVLVRRLEPGQKAKQHPESTAPASTLAYSVVAGERRVRAARLAGLAEVPALICSYAETEALKVALLENIQRENLGAVEEAEAYRNLMDAYGATQEELAEMLGKKRSSVANMLRLLTLEKEILLMLQDRRLTPGHAKVLLGLPAGAARMQLAKLTVSRGLSVRDVEKRVQAGGAKPSRKRAAVARTESDPAVRALRERVEQAYGSPAVIERDAKTGKGTISLRFYGDEDLMRLLKMMGVDTQL
ncbi:MAG TPA: ParB/RepB/Spo0J family partition protein [Candidatus Krumholzibacteria bacterium]|nr:ParB/RepB/Spo0J family partition protein [Candidatus Krumholzibacteria bacterium]